MAGIALRPTRIVLGIVTIALLASAFTLAERLAAARAVDAVSRRARASAILLASSFRRELEKFQLVPVVLAQDSEVRAALAAPAAARLDPLNRKLEALSARLRAANLYVLDAQGVTVAASNWRGPESFVGDDYAFRPYFTEAMRSGAAQQFALGQRSRRPGLYLSRRIDTDGRPLGVVVVKVEFGRLEREWRAAGDAAFVTDARGIILVTADPPARFQTIRPLTAAERVAARRSLDYGAAPLLPNARYAAGRVSGDAIEAVAPVDGWRVRVVAPTRQALSEVRAIARLGFAIALLAALAGWLVWRQRRRSAAARLAAAADARTAGLRHQLVQANKLAILGQVTGGVAHEISQPLAAIASQAHNARTLIERDRPGEAGEAIERVEALTDRIGRITRELRGFSRRATGTVEPVALAEVIDGLRLLLRDRMRMLGAELIIEGPELSVVGERVRLEQVLVNLVQNALDAGARAITVTVEAMAARVRLTVADDGPGLTPEARATLFQPFSTSKRDGLGLGLVISHDIVADLGGTLVALDPPQGAAFAIELERAP